ncbi:MAG: FAD-binding protein [Parcubacteria group bacterium]|nr:FAD-binding protein [Parcubacteria group bacterium]
MDELTKIIQGKVLLDDQSLEHYSYDGSIFSIKPAAAVLPRDRSDIQKLVVWLAQKRKENPRDNRFTLVCRGKGTDQAGGPLGEGVVVRFPGHLDKILEVGTDFCRVEPGVIFGELNSRLDENNKIIPSFPASADFSTMGGAVANVAAGEKTIKYGTTRDYVKGLKVILSSGEEIETKPLDSAELAAKKSRNNFEGEVFRRVDELIEKHRDLIAASKPDVTKNASGYALWEVKKRDGSFDLSQLFVGSQGTLGVITEITFKTIDRPQASALIVGYFDDLEKLGQAVESLVPLGPSAIEMVDHYFLEVVQNNSPELLAGLLPQKLPAYVLLVEFDGSVDEVKGGIGRAEPIIKSMAYEVKVAIDPNEQERLWRLRHSAAAVIMEKLPGPKKALPFVEDGTVNPKYLVEYLHDLADLARRYGLTVPVWGHAADGDMHFQPLIDLADEADRNKIFDFARDVFTVIGKYRGSVSGEHNDGLFRTPYLNITFGKEMVDLFFEVKKIFDPLGIFNPYKKASRDFGVLKKYLRREYNIKNG